MSTWMSIGFDPDQMNLTAEPNTQAVISGARHDATPRPTAGLDQATLSEFGAVSGLNDSSKHWIAGTIKPLSHVTEGVGKTVSEGAKYSWKKVKEAVK